MITPRQRDLLVWVARYIATHRCAPSYDEIAQGLNLASKSQIHAIVTALCERGMMHRAVGGKGNTLARGLMVTPAGASFIKNWREPDAAQGI